MKPKISICIPNYNNEKYLDDCIKSALNQEFEDIEIIVVDDKSTDNSLDVIQKYSDFIKIYHNEENLGQPKNTNKIISLAKGEFIVILHSDDQLLPNFCSTLLPIIENYSNVAMAVGERIETNEINEIERITPFYSVDCIIEGEKQAKVFMMMSFLPCQVLFRKDAFIKSGGVNERHIVNLDGLLWFQISLQGDVAYTRKEVSIYRIHQENTTSMYNKSLNHMLEYYITLSEMFKLAKGKPYLENNFGNAEKRVAVLTLRYLKEVLKNKNYKLAKQYLLLAVVFDMDIINNKEYQELSSILNEKTDTDIEKRVLEYQKKQIKRTHSYEPPEGSIIKE